MAIDWTTLTGAKSTEGSIKNWVVRDNIPVTNILLEAEAWIYQRLRVREMVTSESFVFDAATNEEALPSGFLDPIEYRQWGAAEPLPYVHEATIDIQRDEDGNLVEGTPTQWTIIGETAYVNYQCEEAFSGRLMYFKQPDALSVSNTTNFLTRRYPTLLRVACMAFAFGHMKEWNARREHLAEAEKWLLEAGSTNESYRRGQTTLYM